MANVLLKENERIDDLELNGLKIIQNSKGFCYGTDAVLLSNFAKEIKDNSSIIDLCTGTGIVSILLSAKTNNCKITAVEIQEDVCDMAKRSVLLNDIDNISVVLSDLNNLPSDIKLSSFDAVVVNPPYKKLGSRYYF